MKKYFTQPIVQVLSFSFILIHGFVWIPYSYALVITLLLEFKLFAVFGILGIAFCLLSKYYYKKLLQIAATTLMSSSLLLYFINPATRSETAGVNNVLTIFTLIFFAYIQVMSLFTIPQNNS